LAVAPGVTLRLTGAELDAPLMALASGVSILGASFLLLWACDAAQADVSQALAVAVVALVAVLPEYAVDMYFTWHAGQDPAGDYAHYAIANMTGANRLLIGVAWGAVALLFWLRTRKAVTVEKPQRLELGFLGAATAYAFVIPIKGNLAWYDGLVFLTLFVWYMIVAARRSVTVCEIDGPAMLLVRMPKLKRRLAVIGLFLLASLAILACAKPFCEGLVGTGTKYDIPKFLLVQWLAPIASEAPEFTVALVFAWRGSASLAMGSLISSKVNQWTLLVGMIPGVYALSSGSLAHPLPMLDLQLQEILLTAAQSLLAVVMLASLRFSVCSALLLFTLFAGQFVIPELVAAVPPLAERFSPSAVHPFFSALYIALAAGFFLRRPRAVLEMIHGMHR
jgi:cation:H+ antiporter